MVNALILRGSGGARVLTPNDPMPGKDHGSRDRCAENEHGRCESQEWPEESHLA